MKIKRKLYVIIYGLLLFVLSSAFIGCQHITLSFNGKTVPEPKRIPLLAGGPHHGVWNTKDLSIQYDYTRNADRLSLNGEIAMAEFYWDFEHLDFITLWGNFLDSDGKIIESKVIWTANYAPVFYPGHKKWSIKSGLDVPVNTAAVSFSYMGRFSSPDDDGATHWNFYISPLN